MGSYSQPQNSGTGANMHFSSYLTPCYVIPSPGRPLPRRDGDVTWISRNGCTGLVQPPSYNCNVIYGKQLTRQAMLNHEAAFRYQVRELHHLYKRQKELMTEHRMREIAGHQHQYHRSQTDGLVYPMQPDISQKTVPPWHLVNAKGCVPTVVSERFLPSPSFAGDSIRSDNNLFVTKRSPEYNEGMPPRINQFGERMLDLELPANLYNHSDEEDNSSFKNIKDVPPTVRSLANEIPEFHLECVHPYTVDITGSLDINSSCGGIKLCIDLNEPIQLDDDSYSSSHLNSATCSTQTVHVSPVPSQKPDNDFNASINFLSPEEKQVEQPFNSEAESDNVILVQNSSLDGNSLGSNISCESHNSSITLGSCLLCSPQPVPHSACSDVKVLSSVTSQIKSPSDLREIPLAVKPLPCLNTTKMTEGPKFVYESFSNNADMGKELLQVDTRLGKKMKNSHDHELLEYMDLNCMPLDLETLLGNECEEDQKDPHSSVLMESSSFEDQPSLPSPIRCKLAPSMSDDTEEVGHNARPSCDDVSVKNDEANLAKDTNFQQFSCSKDLNSHLDEDKTPAAFSESTTVTKLQDTEDLNIEAPGSPENSECHPPRGESEDKFEMAVYLPNEAEFTVGEVDKIAAEAIILMSSSRWAMTPELPRPLDNCLKWFAGIASSVSEDLCDEIKKVSNKAGDSDYKVLGSFRTMDFETRKVRVRRATEASCRGKKQNKQGETYECFPRQQGPGRSKQPIKEKYLHAIGMGKRSDVAFENAKRRKRNTGNGFAKQKPCLTIARCSDLEQLIYSSPLCNAKATIAGNCLQGWGMRTGRRKARRGRMVFDFFLHPCY